MKTKNQAAGGIVYSTEQGRMCPACGHSTTACRCQQRKQTMTAKGDGVVRLSLETKGRGGKGVTVIRGLALPEEGLRELAKRLKQRCGSGGTVKEGTIEIQGDHRQAMAEELGKAGYTVKRVGGP